jgi:hypothetical protein
MGFLTSSQTAAIKAQRVRAWNRPFTVEQVVHTPDPDYYDDPVDAVSTVLLSGDYLWRQEHERRGREGGLVDQADLILGTDILHSGTILSGSTRLLVEGRRLAITGLTTVPDSGELIVTAVKIE